ncbi:MAG: ABC transporter permease [Treponema sp.]
MLFFTVTAAFIVPLAGALLPAGGKSVMSTPALHIWRIAYFTFVQALISAAGATLIGLCAAFFCARRAFFGRKALLSLSAIPLSIPPVVIALAFILFFGKNGVLNSCVRMLCGETHSLGALLYSTGGVLLVHTFYNFPIAMRTITSVWEQLPEETEQAAHLLGAAPFHIFRTIIMPALISPAASSFLIIFLYCFFSFIILLLLGGPGLTSLEAELYRELHRDVHSSVIPLIAGIETGIALTVMIGYAGLRKKMQDSSTALQYRREKKPITGGQEKACFALLLLLISLFLLAPLGSLAAYSVQDPKHYQFTFTLKAWQSIVLRVSFWKALATTITTGLITASLAVGAALFFMYLIFASKISRIQHIIPFLPLAVSSVVLGAGWLRFGVYPSIFTLIIVQTSLAWPFAWTHIETCFQNIPVDMGSAARLFTASRTDAFFRLCIPLCKKGIAAAFCSVFAISAGDASLPLVLNIAQFENIALLLFRYAGSYRFAESAAIASVLAVLTAGAFFIQARREVG